MRSLVLLASIVLTPAVAAASPTFPAEIQRILDTPCKPICTTCHTRLEGGIGTARKPFGLAMQSEGLQARSPNLIAPALQKLEASGSDVDNDGVPDVEELRNMEDPNTANTSLECLNETPPDDSGCSVAPETPAGSGTPLVWAFAAALIAARRRARHTYAR